MARTKAVPTGSKAAAATAPGNEELLWQDKHRPRTAKDLAVHVRKVADIRAWMERALAAHAEATASPAAAATFRPHVLALCGGSGCGKSAAVEALCSDLGVRLTRWTDDSWGDAFEGADTHPRPTAAASSTSSWSRGHGGGEWGYQSHAARREEELEDFAVRSTYPSVALVPKGAAPSSRKKQEAVPAKSSAAAAAAFATHKRRKVDAAATAAGGGDVGGDDDIVEDDDDGGFLDGPMHGGASNGHSNGHGKSNGTGKGKSVIAPGKGGDRMDVDGEPPETGPQGLGLGRRIVMVEDPPHLSEGHASLALARPGQPTDHAGAGSGGRGGDPMALARLVGSFRDPVILVISDVHGDDGFHFAADRCLPADVKARVTFEAIFVRPVTPLNVAKVLRRILDEERRLLSGPGRFAKGGSGPGLTAAALALPEAAVTELATACMGDIRHAIAQLQMAVHAHGHRTAHPAPTNGGSAAAGQGRGRAVGKKGAAKAGSPAAAAAVAGTVQRADADGPDAVPGGRRRDGQYSSLYGVAKLLALKLGRDGRVAIAAGEAEGGGGGGAAGVEVVDAPETVVEGTDMGFELVWAFMQFNSVRALSNSHDVASFLLPASASAATSGGGGGGGAAGDWGPEPDGLDQAATALAVYSDIDVLMACRYDPSSLLDRGDVSATAFPEGYATSLLARSAAVARGPGARERYEAGKARGGRAVFTGIFRPTVLSLHAQRRQLGAQLRLLRGDLALAAAPAPLPWQPKPGRPPWLAPPGDGDAANARAGARAGAGAGAAGAAGGDGGAGLRGASWGTLLDAVCDYLPCLRAVEHALAVDQAAWEAWDRDRQAAYQRHLAAPNIRQGFAFPDPPYRRVDCVLPAAVRWRVRAVLAMEAGGADARGPGAAPAPAAVEAGAGAWLATDDIAEFDD